VADEMKLVQSDKFSSASFLEGSALNVSSPKKIDKRK
jgi:hypothetical protein